MKSTWRVLNEIMNRKTQKNRLPSTFKIDNHEISNPKEIANCFCEYFTNIGPNLAYYLKISMVFEKAILSLLLCYIFLKKYHLQSTGENTQLVYSLTCQKRLIRLILIFCLRNQNIMVFVG